ATITQDIYTPGDSYTPASFPRLKADCNAVNPYFVAVLIPTASDVQPSVRFENTHGEKTVVVEWFDRSDRIVWNKTLADQFGAVQLVQVKKDKTVVK
ncbi:MAG: hypothetical protein AB7E95_07480, partial [Kiritimatiellales bacterium]